MSHPEEKMVHNMHYFDRFLRRFPLRVLDTGSSYSCEQNDFVSIIAKVMFKHELNHFQ